MIAELIYWLLHVATNMKNLHKVITYIQKNLQEKYRILTRQLEEIEEPLSKKKMEFMFIGKVVT